MASISVPAFTGNKKFSHYVLHDGATSAEDGTWVDVRAWRRISLQLTITNATCQVRGSLAATKPANTTDGVQIGSDISADCIVSLPDKYAWIKIKITSITGTLTAYAMGESSVYGII